MVPRPNYPSCLTQHVVEPAERGWFDSISEFAEFALHFPTWESDIYLGVRALLVVKTGFPRRGLDPLPRGSAFKSQSVVARTRV